jgi:hypothetical protein
LHLLCILLSFLYSSRLGRGFSLLRLQWKMASAQSQMHEGVTSPPKGKSRIPILLLV